MARIKRTPGTPNLLRQVNRGTIFNLLEELGVTSRSELSRRSGLSAPTVSAVVGELEKEGWIENVGDGVSQGGKRPKMIRLNPDARYIGAIQMNRDRIRIRVTNLMGTVYAEEQMVTPAARAELVCRDAAERLWDLLHAQRLEEKKVLGVGVAVPGVVNDNGEVSRAPEFGWNREPIRSYLESYFKTFPVVLENDVKLAALGEAWRRKTISGTVVYVYLGQGIGAGILIDGHLYRGAHFAAGEMGNLIVDPMTVQNVMQRSERLEERPGFFESHFGLAALHEGYEGFSKLRLAEGDATSEEVLIEYLTYGVVNLIALLDPDTIVFGGEMTYRIENFLGKLSNTLSRYVEITPKMYISPLGNDASLVGATRAVLDHYKKQLIWSSV